MVKGSPVAPVPGAKGSGEYCMTKMTKNPKRAILLLGLLPFLLAGCETVAGAGQDIATAGHAITGTAQQAK